jgi:hypothetical protein
MSKNTPEKPTNATVRESADEKMMKALVHQAMKNVLGKRDVALLAVAQQMIEDGEVKEKLPEKLSEKLSEKNADRLPSQSSEIHLSDDELLNILDRKALE